MPPRKRVFDKKNAQNFQLVFRSQNDPRIHDPDAPGMVFAERQAPNSNKHRNDDWDAPTSNGASTLSGVSRSSKIKSRRDLEGEYGGRVRVNEGEAANYGIFYDDSQYDYMQHLREMGTSGNATFVPAKTGGDKGKKKMKLEDMLENMNMGDGQSEAGMSMSSTASSSAADLFGEDMAPSEFVRPSTYQDQQNIPDAIAGFQPDMDPRLREVLEALEDEAYVDDEDDIFDELAKDGQEVDPRAWQNEDEFDDEDDGWATDDTIKPTKESKSPQDAVSREGVDLPPADGPAPDVEDVDGDWMAEFNKFKKDAKAQKTQKQTAAPSELQSFVTGTDMTGARRKKRKGAKTSTSNYSMTSSALFRTDQQSLLDERFEKIEEEYANDGFGDDNMSLASGMSGISVYSKASEMDEQAPGLRTDFDSILDEFSGQFSGSGRKRGNKRNGYKDGLAQLDDIRKDLGPAKFKQSSKAR
ncbi:low-temperature viability protein-like protein ltv1 [Phyllosticta citriasiana]|uniref:Low-temperature viability protein-like protein ltv1 n=1 Tax=Phyllosticta citriasiana TaxID=595635 RepID=A0ABR1KZP2_9PEZI